MKKILLLLLFVSLQAHAFFKDEVNVTDGALHISIPIDKLTVGNPAPTVILAHTCAGIIQSMDIQQWGYNLKRWGYNVVFPDSFRPRGYRDICNNTTAVTAEQRGQDIAAVAEWVRKQPWHKGKIALIGFSHGGRAAMEVSNRTKSSVDVVVAYYPWCRSLDTTPQVPTQIHVGNKDDWTPSDRCEKIAKNNKNYSLYVYDGVYHSFDRPAPDRYKEGNHGFKHKLAYDPTAAAQAEERTKKFFEQYLK